MADSDQALPFTKDGLVLTQDVLTYRFLLGIERGVSAAQDLNQSLVYLLT